MSLVHWLPFMPTFVLAFFRIAAMMLFAPLFGSTRIPRRVRAMFALVLAIAIAPGLTPVMLPESLASLTLGIAGEMCFGLAMGMVLSFVFISTQWAGEIIGQQMGLNLGEVFDPQYGSQGSVVGDMYYMLTLVIFLTIGGHKAMLLGVRDSFDKLPLLSLNIGYALFDTLIKFLGSATDLAIRLAAPMLVTMLIVDLALGLIGKIMPQMNVMAAGLSLRSALGLIVVIVGLTMTNDAIADGMFQAMREVQHAWVAGQALAHTMAEDFGDKTEAPTPRRRQEARDQGKIAQSKDLASAVALVGAMVMLKNFGFNIIGALKAILAEMLGRDSMGPGGGESSALEAAARSLIIMGTVLAPLLIGLMLMVVVVDILQVGLVFNSKRLQPNIGALNPFKGFGRLFNGQRSPVQGAISLGKLLLVSFVAYSAISSRLPQIVLAQQLDFIKIFELGAGVMYTIGIRIGIVLLLLAIIEYAYQRYKLEQELKMTKQEVKDEMRRMDGDPKIKQRRLQVARQMMKEQLKKDVPTADVIVTNPTHFAIALKYDSDAMHAPRVVAKGHDFLAQRIREIAIANGIPILERPPLARALYKLVKVGQEIPEQYYAAVAEILAYVYELSGKMKFSRQPT